MLEFERHDHRSCIARGVAAAQDYCTAHRLQFTPVRRRVLELLLERHRALGAYEILDALRAEGLGSQPPVAYRALEFLVSHGFAHKVERLNAFVACRHMGEDHAPVFLICRQCDRVAEAGTATAPSGLDDAARKAGFTTERIVAEAIGLCPACTEAAPKTGSAS